MSAAFSGGFMWRFVVKLAPGLTKVCGSMAARFVHSSMLKILDIGQIRELDQHTTQFEPVKSIDLMERACKAFVNWFELLFDKSNRVGVVCGTGNNGGDGLGIARLLHADGYSVKVWIVRGGKESPDFAKNHARLKGKIEAQDFADSMETFNDVDMLIDALFGSGLTRSAEKIQEKAILAMNRSSAIRVAVDIPSGLFADQHTDGSVVKANHTVTFQLPKLAFLLPENEKYVGDWHTVDIGLDKAFIRDCETFRYCMTHAEARKLLRPRHKFSHKGDHGRALLVSGSLGKMGAAVLASRGALRAGVGLLTVHVPTCGNDILQTAVPEAMLSLDPSGSYFSKAPDAEAYDVIGIGPGLGQAEQTAHALANLLDTGKPMVIDADALNLLSTHRELLHLVPKDSILTPHPKEFERLVGKWTNDFDRLGKQIALARQLRSVVLVKGAHTAIATADGEIIFNTTGNPGMATGGTGDVLTGVLTGLRAQGYPAREAALLGVFVHGHAGNLAAMELGQIGLVAGDLADFLPLAFRSLG